MSRVWKGLIPILAALAVWAIPTPHGLEPYAWQYFSIFVGVVVALILEPIPAAAVGLVGVVLCASLMLVPAPEPPKPPAPKADAAKPANPAETPKPPDGVMAPNTAKPVAAKSDAAKPETAKPDVTKPDAAMAPAAVAANATASPAAKPAPDAAAKPAVKKPPKPADEVKWALAGFSNGTVWLIFIAFMFALGYEKTGLGKRISLVLIKALGKRTLGLGYAVALADLALAPFMPSNTARSGGTIFPIIKNIPGLYGSTPEHEPRKLGGYLMWVALATTCVTSSMTW